jgi:ABC-2 type transport system permease protein
VLNNNKVPLLLCNKDTGEASRQLVKAIEKAGMFKKSLVQSTNETEREILDKMHRKDALVAIIIPGHFSQQLSDKATMIAGKALTDFGIEADTTKPITTKIDSLSFYYHPVLQQSFRQSVQGALTSALQLVQSKQIIKKIYGSLTEKEMTDTIEMILPTTRFP